MSMEQLRNYLQASKARKEAPARDAAQISNRLHEVFDRMAKQSALKSRAQLLHTGFQAMDEIIGGLELGELIVINGDPGAGQTSMMLSIAITTAKETQMPILLYSQNHSAQQITRRLLSMLTGVHISAIENADLTDAEWNLLSTASSWLQEKDIRVYDLDQTIPELCVSINRCDTPALVIVDGLSSDELEPENFKLLKNFAQEKNCCVIFNGFYATNRQYISGNVDKVFHLDNYYENETIFEVNWNRTGQKGRIDLLWYQPCLQFLPISSENDENESE